MTAPEIATLDRMYAAGEITAERYWRARGNPPPPPVPTRVATTGSTFGFVMLVLAGVGVVINLQPVSFS